MGFLDKISDKAKEAAENAKKAAGEAIGNLSETARDLSGKASVGFTEFTDKASKEIADISQKATAEGTYIFGKVTDGFSSLSENATTTARELSAWAETMPGTLRKMADDFDAETMWDKLSKTAAKAGQDLIVMVLTIYYSIESKIVGNPNPGNDAESK